MTTPPTPEQVAELTKKATQGLIRMRAAIHPRSLNAERLDAAFTALSALQADNARLWEAITVATGRLTELTEQHARGKAAAHARDTLRFLQDALSPTTPGDAREGASRD